MRHGASSVCFCGGVADLCRISWQRRLRHLQWTQSRSLHAAEETLTLRHKSGDAVED